MKILKRILFLGLLLNVFVLVGCNLSNSSSKLPDSKPKDFNFVFNYGINAKNRLNTIQGNYTKDMIGESPITINLKLSDKDMESIYSEMKKINILSYPENFEPQGNVLQKPFKTYTIKAIYDGKEKNIFWKDENMSKDKNAVQLRDLFKKIQETIESKEDYKKLPIPQSGYE
ncbi:hypothetical protein [Clostridium scatologenes]|uniref:DUF6856 family protein n=1 Tax=Clostridium scatologenes TaxID=1548 RepID=UPI00048F7081|nr:hypothetical protein [Clostridium scatologenes]